MDAWLTFSRATGGRLDAYLKEDAAICTECGEHLPDKHEDEHLSEKTAKRDAALAYPDGKKKHNWFRRKHRKPEAPVPDGVGESVNDGYDGYYNDVLPPDLERIKEGLDKELIKRIIILIIAVVLVISCCVTLMYMM